MNITVAQLVAAGVSSKQASLFAAPLSAACERFDIGTAARVGAFLGQCRVESANFTKLSEGLWWNDAGPLMRCFPSRVSSLQQAFPLLHNDVAFANYVYSGKNGNGDVASGDGYRFHGRGLIQLTGRANYAAAAAALDRPYLEKPELVAQPADACLTAAWFFAEHGGNALADAGDFDAITRMVNGKAMLEAQARREYSEEATRAFA
jgi:putative chitinase